MEPAEKKTTDAPARSDRRVAGRDRRVACATPSRGRSPSRNSRHLSVNQNNLLPGLVTRHNPTVRPTFPAFPEAKIISQAGRTFHVSWNGQAEDAAWDDFLLTLPDAHHEQTSLWGSVRALLGWTVVRVVLREDGEIIGGAQVQLQAIQRVGRWAYITFGPCSTGNDPGVGKILMTEIKKFLRREHALYLLAQLPYDGEPLAHQLQGDGFIQAPRALAPGNMRATLVLDLGKTEAQLLAEMRATRRNEIRQGLKRGLTVTEGGAGDLNDFWALMCALCARRKTTPNPSSPDFFHQLWKQFSPRGWIKVFVAKHEGKTVAAALAFPFGGWFRVWKVGWAGACPELRPNQMLWWTMICQAKNLGCRHFDFVSVELGESAGPSEFKLGFGGEVKMLPGVYCYFSNPLVRLAMRGGLARLLDSRQFVRLAQRVRRGR